MSAAAIAAPPDTSSMTMEQELGATLQEAAESVLGAPDAAAEPPQIASEQAPPGEGGNGPSLPTSPPVETPPGEGPSSYKLTPDGSAYLVPKAELPTITGLRTYAETVQNRFPTTNDAELGYLESSDFRAMRSDFLNPDGKNPQGENNLDGMLSYWAGKAHSDPAVAAQFRDSFVKMAERIPETLKSINPEAHAKLGDSIVSARIESAYARAAETGDPEDLLAAQRMDWGQTGRYKTELPKHDPQKAEMDRIAQERLQVDQRTAQLLNRDWTSFNKGSLEGPKWQQFNAEIDKTLAPVKGKYDPEVFDALRERISKQMLTKIQEDFEWARNHGNDLTMLKSNYEQLWKAQKPADGLKPRIQTYTNDFMARVRRHLPSIAAPLLNKATASAVAAPQPKPPAGSPQQPAPRAANGQFQQPQKARTFYNVHEDPEFTSAFNVQ